MTKEALNFYQRVAKVQQELKAPKDQNGYNGQYQYRKIEDILHSAKDLLFENDLCLIISDRIICESGRFYVQSTARIQDCLTDKFLESIGCSREPEKAGIMSAPQVTGSSSTYARKRALDGLFLLDDSKDDPDAQKQDEIKNPPRQSKPVINKNDSPQETIKLNQTSYINSLIAKIVGEDVEAHKAKLKGLLDCYKVDSLESVLVSWYPEITKILEKQANDKV